VVIVLDSQLQGHGFKYHTILDGNGVKAMLGSISATNSGWFDNLKKENIGSQNGTHKKLIKNII